MNDLEIVPVAWEVRRPGANEDERTLIDIRIVDRGVDGPAYAVTRHDRETLRKSGKWEFEPLSTGRSKAYKQRCRWDNFDEAAAAARAAYGKVRERYAHYLDKQGET